MEMMFLTLNPNSYSTDSETSQTHTTSLTVSPGDQMGGCMVHTVVPTGRSPANRALPRSKEPDLMVESGATTQFAISGKTMQTDAPTLGGSTGMNTAKPSYLTPSILTYFTLSKVPTTNPTAIEPPVVMPTNV